MKICAHTIVKNEDRYLWFAVKSVISFVDEILIWDTGSSDLTREIIAILLHDHPDKIKYRKFENVNVTDFTQLKNEMLQESNCDWIFILDGDEVWWEDSIRTIRKTIDEKGDELDTIVSPFVNPVGDIYNYRNPVYGRYSIGDKIGDITVRCINRKINGLHVANPYGNEGYYNKDNIPVQKLSISKMLFIDKLFMHFTHLKRSSINIDSTMQRKGKFKYELGKKFPNDYFYPEVFFIDRPDIIATPWLIRGFCFKIISSLQLLPKRVKNILHF